MQLFYFGCTFIFALPILYRLYKIFFISILSFSVFLISCVSLYTPFVSHVYADSGDWPTYLHDSSHNSANLDETSLSVTTAANLQQKWIFKTNGTIASSATVVNNVVYVGSWDGYEYAIDASTGNQIWKQYLGITTDKNCTNTPTAGITSTATVQDGVLYVGGGDSYWYALDSATGNILWKIFVGDNSPLTTAHYNWASPLIYKGFAYIGTSSYCDHPLNQGQLLQVDLSTHSITHVFDVVSNNQTGGGIWTSPAVDPNSDTIFVTTGTLNGTEPLAESMISLDAKTLSLIGSWQIPSNPSISDADWGTSPLVYFSSGKTMVSAINKNGILYSFDATNISAGPVWQQTVAKGGDCPQCGDGSISSGAFASNTLFYAAGKTIIGGTSYNGSVRSFNPQTGGILWEHGTSKTPFSAIAYANGVIVDAPGNTLEVLNATNGAQLFSTILSKIVYGAPTVANGTIYTGTIDGNLYAFSIGATIGTPKKFGGLDLDSYCGSLNQGTASLNNSTWICTNTKSSIDLNLACQWQYNTLTITSIQDIPGNPYSWTCYQLNTLSTPTPTPTPTPTSIPQNTRLGGLNLDGFCQNIGQGNVLLINGDWICKNAIKNVDMENVCQWQYEKIAPITAVQDISGNPYSWSCYTSGNTPTPTPTPTQLVLLGGLNLDGFCQNLGYSSETYTNTTWTCNNSPSPIDLTIACKWQYTNAININSQQTKINDPFSWACFGSK